MKLKILSNAILEIPSDIYRSTDGICACVVKDQVIIGSYPGGPYKYNWMTTYRVSEVNIFNYELVDIRIGKHSYEEVSELSEKILIQVLNYIK